MLRIFCVLFCLKADSKDDMIDFVRFMGSTSDKMNKYSGGFNLPGFAALLDWVKHHIDRICMQRIQIR